MLPFPPSSSYSDPGRRILVLEAYETIGGKYQSAVTVTAPPGHFLIPISIPVPAAPSGAPDPRSRLRRTRRPLRE